MSLIIICASISKMEMPCNDIMAISITASNPEGGEEIGSYIL